jgi:hypothetical protein
LFACSQVFDEVTASELAEALAVRCALALVREEGFDKIILASNCLSVIQRINSPLMDRTDIDVVIQDVKAMMTDFSSVEFLHISRLLNVLAYILARRAKTFSFSIFCDWGPDVSVRPFVMICRNQ